MLTKLTPGCVYRAEGLQQQQTRGSPKIKGGKFTVKREFVIRLAGSLVELSLAAAELLITGPCLPQGV